MAPEAKLYKKLKSVSKDIVWTRLENLSLLGTPDLLGYNNNCNFFTLELKMECYLYCVYLLVFTWSYQSRISSSVSHPVRPSQP